MVRKVAGLGQNGNEVQAAWVEYNDVLTKVGFPRESENSA